ncbi:MAG: ATP-binding cassette domain-containing protein [Planctomycetota bacterium]
MSGAALEVRGATVRYGAQVALAQVDLRIRGGETVALVGPSGAGKTTLLRLLGAALRPEVGAVHVDGEAVDQLAGRRLRAVRAKLGFVHQDLGLVPQLRVVQNVLVGDLGRQSFLGALRLLARPPRADVVAAHRLLERVGVAGKLYERTDRLSGGEQQRVALARALYQRPSALLADEPVAAVDPARARDTIELLHTLARDEGLTLCASLHSVDLAREFFARLIGLRGGRVVFDRPSAAVGEADLARLYELEPRHVAGG